MASAEGVGKLEDSSLIESSTAPDIFMPQWAHCYWAFIYMYACFRFPTLQCCSSFCIKYHGIPWS